MGLSPSRTGLLAQTFWRSPGSRAHCLLTCLDSSTTPGPAATRDLTRLADVAFPLTEKGRHPGCMFSELNHPARQPSVYASLRSLTRSQARLEARMESLLLFRRALASPTMCRFIPALSVLAFLVLHCPRRENTFRHAAGTLRFLLTVTYHGCPQSPPCSKARSKKSTSSCLRPSSRSSSATRSSAALAGGGLAVFDLLPGGRPTRRSNPALPSTSNRSRHW